MDKILLVGAGGHAYSCISVLELLKNYKIEGLIDNNKLIGSEILGYKILGKDSEIPKIRKTINNAIVTVGQIKSAKIRIRLFNFLKEQKFNLPVIISPRSYVSNYSNIGEGTIIMHDVVANSDVKIGKNCIINNKALIEHGVSIGDNCHISTGAILNGDVAIGDNTFIGSGSVIMQSIAIGSDCIIGAGSIIKTGIKSSEMVKN